VDALVWALSAAALLTAALSGIAGLGGGQKYGYGISLMGCGPNRVYFHGGEMPGFNSFMGYDPVNDVLWSCGPTSPCHSTASTRPTPSC
jgi:hypothetical protein